MVDQPEGRPKSPKPGKVKQVSKKHSVSKPYERPSSSRGVLARVKELITPVTPGWLKDLVLKPPQTTSVTDALEQTVAEVQAVEEKRPEDFKRALKNLTLPVKEDAKKLPYTVEPVTPKAVTAPAAPSPIVPAVRNPNILEETLGEVKWSSIRPAVKEKYSFSVAAFNTPSKSRHHSRSTLNTSSSSSPFTARSRVSFGGSGSLQRSFLAHRNASSTCASSTAEEKRPITVKPISRSTIRPGVTSNTAKKILEQLESLSRPLGHLPSSRPSTPSSRPCSRASTPLSSRPSTPANPYQRGGPTSVPIRSLTSTPAAPPPLEGATPGGKIRRDRAGGHYRRVAEDEGEGVEVPHFEPVTVPAAVEIRPIKMETPAPAPIKIVNQAPKENHVSLKDAFTSRLPPSASPTTAKRPSSVHDDNSNDSNYSFSLPATAGQRSGSESASDPTEFSFGSPSPAVDRRVVEEILKSVSEVVKEEVKEEKIEVPAKEPPGSWSCVPCRLSNPSTMSRCSGCEAPNPASAQVIPLPANSPLGIKRAPITPMKPSPKVMKTRPSLTNISEEAEEEKKGTVTFTLPKQQDDAPAPAKNPLLAFAVAAAGTWSCDTCLLSNPGDVERCKACETAKPAAKPAVAKPAAPAAKPSVLGGSNPLLAFAKKSGWECSMCMLNNEDSLDACKACQTAKPGAGGGAAKPAATASVAAKPVLALGSNNPLLAFAKKAGWECSTCMLHNEESVDACAACQTVKPGAAPAAKEPAASAAATGGTFKFGMAAGATSSTLSFGAPTEPGKSFSFGMPKGGDGGLTFGDKKEGDTKPTFSFGAKPAGDKATEGTPSAAPSFSFGAAKTEEKTTEPAKPAFSFGVAATTSAATEEKKPAFSFGGAETPAVSSSTTTPSFSFGGTAPAAPKTESSAPSFSFGGDKKAETPSFSFGATKSESKAPTFNFGGGEKKDTPGFSFGGATTATAAKKTDAAPSFNFGGTTEPPKTGFNFGGGTTAPATGGFSFGGTATTTETPKPTTGFTFGATPAATAGVTPAAPTFNFGGTKPATSTSTFGSSAGGFQFGGPGNAMESSGDTMDASSQSPKGFSFGQQKPAATNGPGFSFGGSNNANSSTSAGFNFGGSATNSTATGGFGTTPAPSFSFGQSSAATAPTFGATNSNTSTPTFGQSATAAPTPGFSFGGSSATTAPTSATTGFNFGAPAPAATPSFSFGAAAPAENKGFSFGGTSTTSVPAAPTFGANPAPSFSTPTPAPTFNFGGGSTSAAPAAGSSPFQFGSSPGTPSNNMFNPVSSTTSGRKIKKAVRRTKR